MKKRGFTLAEVLITLGIIGIIASITLPALMSNMDKTQFANGLKTAQNIFTNGFAQMKATEMVDILRDTDLFSCYSEKVTSHTSENHSCILQNMKKYFAITNYNIICDM